ncbi:MAG: 16S rRNA (cytidine(1402)-2'-O)-methyltransferase [Clostridia bacterium]|nr:16S rRNA (cytidine(1402)-2'-O)-methyltransferase [Clostridia bacterium]
MNGIITPETNRIGTSEETEKNRVTPRTLYLVATPIGNLSDLSPRALKVLNEVSFIAAEDTRNSANLLQCFGIHTPLISYHEHNRKARGEEILRKLKEGASCALITDAGTPAISDPGEDLVVLCAEEGIPVIGIPGCCAAVTALSVSGLPTGKFVFEGFLPTQKAQKAERLEKLKYEERTVLLYEAPHRLKSTLQSLRDAFGPDRRIALCRELTKRNEETLRMTLGEAVSRYESAEPRGEYVIVLEGCPADAWREGSVQSSLSPEEYVQAILDKNPGMKRLEAVKKAAKEYGIPRGDLYDSIMKKEN